MYCCSMAVFICAAGKERFCTPCHNNAMTESGASPQTKCIGGDECPLGLAAHPPASWDHKLSRFPLGCSLCRSENLDQIVNNDKASAGVNVERRQDMKERFDEVYGHALEKEIIVMRPKARVAQLGEVENIADQ